MSIAIEPQAAQLSRRWRGTAGRLAWMPDRNFVSPIGGRPNYFLGIGSDETEGGGVRRLNERRAAKKTAAVAGGVVALPAATGRLIAGAAMVAVEANDRERIKGRGRRSGLDQTEASDKRLQCERIGGDPSDRSPRFAPRASDHDNLPLRNS